MNKHSSFLIKFAQLALCFLLTVSTLCCANDESTINQPVAKQAIQIDFNKLRTAKTAKLLLLPWSDLSWIKPLQRWDEDFFKKYSCKYTTQDQTYIGSLIMILQRSNFNEAVSYPNHQPAESNRLMHGTRLGVYLTFVDGSEAKFFIQQEITTTSEIDAMFTLLPKNINYALRANHNLPWYLALWASHIGDPTGENIPWERQARNQNNEPITIKGFLSPARECNDYIRKNVYLEM